ncbi:MAG: (Fe-S)-binding protein [Saprospiraceae bacterium]|nr:(Fe-S)-binding protein [Saprospiraceae bacterium]
MLEAVIFALVTLAAFGLAYVQFNAIRQKINLGKDEDITGDSVARWKNVLLVAFGQKKMFKRWLPAIFHLFIYVAFLFTQIELIEILIDGFTGQHRFFADKIGIFYPLMINIIEVLSVLAFVGTIIFLWRRNVLKVPRFWTREMTSWPRLDGNLILIGELLLITGIMSMNGADLLLQEIDPAHYPDTGPLFISSVTSSLFFEGLSESTLVVIERAGWWLHILVVYAFLNYLPHSKHLHIFLSFPNTYFARLKPRGKMLNMPEVMNEVRSMLGLTSESEVEMSEELPEFGSKDVFDLSWKNLMDAYSCTECGRCTAVCPAHITGKKLSPRKILMDIRDRADEVAKKIGINGWNSSDHEGFDDGKSLFDYISREEIRACTTCMACVEACPVLIDPLEPILKLRRYEILTESSGPSDWMPMFTSLENNGVVWQVTESRTAWTNDEN